MRNNEGRTQIPPELLEQFMKQQEEKVIGQQTQQQTFIPQTQQGGYQVPTDFVELPSEGKFYPPGHPWHGKQSVEVKFMTTKEEDILSSEALAKAGLMFDRLIQSISVDRIDPATILPGDKSAILINARKNAYGKDYSFASFCVKCLTEFEHTINLDEVGAKEFDFSKVGDDGTIVVTLPVSNKEVKFKMANSGDLQQITKSLEAKKKHGIETSETFEFHRAMIVSVDNNFDPNFIISFINQMLIKDSKFLKKCYEDFRPDIDFSYNYTCKECSNPIQGGVPVGANFFWSID